MIANHIIDTSKRSHTGEIIVTLFEYCDLSCVFCSQNHDSTLGIHSIPEKIEQVRYAISELKKKGKSSFSINIMGGEVFSDGLNDSIFDHYAQLVSEIQQFADFHNFEVQVSFTTNFIWTKRQRVKDFLKKTKVKLLTSYDPSGRFNSKTLLVFNENVIEFASHIRSVNCIMTRTNIDKFLQNQIPFFSYLYQNFPIYFDYYTPEKNMSKLLPRDVDLRDFMIYMSTHWPECFPFCNFRLRLKQNMSCMDTLTVLPDSSFGGCTLLLGNVGALASVPSKSLLEQEWFDDYKCLECQHFDRCSFGCFLSNHIKDARTQKECWLSEVYNHIDGLSPVKRPHDGNDLTI